MSSITVIQGIPKVDDNPMPGRNQPLFAIMTINFCVARTEVQDVRPRKVCLVHKGVKNFNLLWQNLLILLVCFAFLHVLLVAFFLNIFVGIT